MSTEKTTPATSRASHCYPIFAVDQKLYFVPRDSRWNTPRMLSIAKIGRKWATLDNDYRFEFASERWMYVDGGEYASPGTLYLSEQHYADQSKASELSRKIGDHMRYGRTNIPLDKLIDAAKLLGVEFG